MSIKRPMRIRCGIRSPQLARGACLLAMADSWRFWVKNSTGTSGRWRTFDHKPQPDELRITVQQSAVAGEPPAIPYLTSGHGALGWRLVPGGGVEPPRAEAR